MPFFHKQSTESLQLYSGTGRGDIRFNCLSISNVMCMNVPLHHSLIHGNYAHARRNTGVCYGVCVGARLFACVCVCACVSISVRLWGVTLCSRMCLSVCQYHLWFLLTMIWAL